MIILASDHAGVEMKQAIMKHLDDEEVEYINLGCDKTTSVDYPDYAHALCDFMEDHDFGILICGTGIGMSIVANRYDHIRCAVVNNVVMATASRKHNDANVIALGARLIDIETAIDLVDVFVETEFEGGRHETRLKKINDRYPLDEPREGAFKGFMKATFGITW